MITVESAKPFWCSPTFTSMASTPISQSPFVTSGVRIGTPALTTRGMKEEDMLDIADLIAEALNNRADADALERVRQKVLDLTRRFSLPI